MRPEKQQVEDCATGWKVKRVNKKVPQFSTSTDIEMIPSNVCCYRTGSYESYYLEMLVRLTEKKEAI